MFTNILSIWIYKLITKSISVDGILVLIYQLKLKINYYVYFIDSASLGEVPATTIVPILYGRSRALVNDSFKKFLDKVMIFNATPRARSFHLVKSDLKMLFYINSFIRKKYNSLFMNPKDLLSKLTLFIRRF